MIIKTLSVSSMSFELASGEKFDWKRFDEFLAALKKDLDKNSLSAESASIKIREYLKGLHLKHDGAEIDWEQITIDRWTEISKINKAIPGHNAIRGHAKIAGLNFTLRGMKDGPAAKLHRIVDELRPRIIKYQMVNGKEIDNGENSLLELTEIEKQLSTATRLQLIGEN